MLDTEIFSIELFIPHSQELIMWNSETYRSARNIFRATDCAFWTGPGGDVNLHRTRRTTARGNYNSDLPIIYGHLWLHTWVMDVARIAKQYHNGCIIHSDAPTRNSINHPSPWTCMTNVNNNQNKCLHCLCRSLGTRTRCNCTRLNDISWKSGAPGIRCCCARCTPRTLVITRAWPRIRWAGPSGLFCWPESPRWPSSSRRQLVNGAIGNYK